MSSRRPARAGAGCRRRSSPPFSSASLPSSAAWRGPAGVSRMRSWAWATDVLFRVGWLRRRAPRPILYRPREPPRAQTTAGTGRALPGGCRREREQLEILGIARQPHRLLASESKSLQQARAAGVVRRGSRNWWRGTRFSASPHENAMRRSAAAVLELSAGFGRIGSSAEALHGPAIPRPLCI